jgi:hypothetical protein
MMTIGRVIFKVAKAVIVAGVAAVGAKAAYSAVKAVKKTKAEVEEREKEKTHIDYSEDPDGVTVYEKEIVSKKEAIQMCGWNFLDTFVESLPGKAGEIESDFWKLWSGFGFAACGLLWGYIFCAADHQLDVNEAGRKYRTPINDTPFAEAAGLVESYMNDIPNGVVYAFGKDYSGAPKVGKFGFDQVHE